MYGDLIQAIKVIKFYFNSFGSFSSQIDSIQPIFENILITMHDLGQQQLAASLDLALTMIARFENSQKLEEINISNGVKNFQIFFVQLCNEDTIDISIFEVAARLVVILEKFARFNSDTEWLECLKSFNEKASFFNVSGTFIESDPKYDFLLIKIECLIKLAKKGNSDIQEKIEGHMKDIMEALWTVLQSEYHFDSSVELILQFEKLSHSDFVSVIDTQ